MSYWKPSLDLPEPPFQRVPYPLISRTGHPGSALFCVLYALPDTPITVRRYKNCTTLADAHNTKTINTKNTKETKKNKKKKRNQRKQKNTIFQNSCEIDGPCREFRKIALLVVLVLLQFPWSRCWFPARLLPARRESACGLPFVPIKRNHSCMFPCCWLLYYVLQCRQYRSICINP